MTTDNDKVVAELRRHEQNREFEARSQAFFRNVVHLEPKPDDKPGEPPERWHTLGELADRADREVHVVKDAAVAAKLRLYRAPGVEAPAPPESWLVRHRSACELNEREGWQLDLLSPPPPPSDLNWPVWATWRGLADALNEGHPHYAPELATAVRLWIELHRDPDGHAKKSKVAAAASRLGRSKEAAGRIATVANPHKGGGAPPTVAKTKPAPQ